MSPRLRALLAVVGLTGLSWLGYYAQTSSGRMVHVESVRPRDGRGRHGR